LLELGMPPSKEMGKILHAAFDAQLEGLFFDVPQALRWLGEQKDIVLAADVRENLRHI
jgi:hypothetical protein